MILEADSQAPEAYKKGRQCRVGAKHTEQIVRPVCTWELAYYVDCEDPTGNTETPSPS